MKVRAILVAACVLTTISATPANAVTPIVVISTPHFEFHPVASTAFLAWTVQDFIPRYSSAVRAEAIGGSSFLVAGGSKGVYASTGGVDGSTLMYSTDDHGAGDIALFDLPTKTPMPVPDGVNTSAYEAALGISGTHLLFLRYTRHGYAVILFDTQVGTSLTIFSHKDSGQRFLEVQRGQVDGNYATWDAYLVNNSSQATIRCDVRLYDIAQATLTRVPNPKKRCQSGPGVNAQGTLYFDRSGLSYGQHARVIRYPLGGPGTIIYALPKGHDFGGAVAVDTGGGNTDLYFDPVGDIWELPGV